MLTSEASGALLCGVCVVITKLPLLNLFRKDSATDPDITDGLDAAGLRGDSLDLTGLTFAMESLSLTEPEESGPLDCSESLLLAVSMRGIDDEVTMIGLENADASIRFSSFLDCGVHVFSRKLALMSLGMCSIGTVCNVSPNELRFFVESMPLSARHNLLTPGPFAHCL